MFGSLGSMPEARKNGKSLFAVWPRQRIQAAAGYVIRNQLLCLAHGQGHQPLPCKTVRPCLRSWTCAPNNTNWTGMEWTLCYISTSICLQCFYWVKFTEVSNPSIFLQSADQDIALIAMPPLEAYFISSAPTCRCPVGVYFRNPSDNSCLLEFFLVATWRNVAKPPTPYLIQKLRGTVDSCIKSMAPWFISSLFHA